MVSEFAEHLLLDGDGDYSEKGIGESSSKNGIARKSRRH